MKFKAISAFQIESSNENTITRDLDKVKGTLEFNSSARISPVFHDVAEFMGRFDLGTHWNELPTMKPISILDEESGWIYTPMFQIKGK